MALGDQLGLRFQDSKTVWPCTSLEFLGIELDSVAMEARLPADKLAFLHELLASWSSKVSATLKETQELVGFLQFTSQVIPYSRSFLRRIIDFLTKFRSPFSRRWISAGVRADLHWWSTFATPWNGVRLLLPVQTNTEVYTNASGSKGLGGYFGDSWFSTRAP